MKYAPPIEPTQDELIAEGRGFQLALAKHFKDRRRAEKNHRDQSRREDSQ